jgi:hypothetical protein
MHHNIALQASKLLSNEAPVAAGLLDESIDTVNEIVNHIFQRLGFSEAIPSAATTWLRNEAEMKRLRRN